MISLDTNVVVRLLVNSPQELSQIEAAKLVLSHCDSAYITQIVQIEMVWVLGAAYNFDKENIIQALKHIQSHQIFELQHPHHFSQTLKRHIINEYK